MKIDPHHCYSEQVRSFWKKLSIKVRAMAVVGSVGVVSIRFYKGRLQMDGLAGPLWALFLTRSLIYSPCENDPSTKKFHCKSHLHDKATTDSLHTLLCIIVCYS
jgi:hypothetical protein